MSVDLPRWYLDTLLTAQEATPVGLYHRLQRDIDPQTLAVRTHTPMWDVPPVLRGPNWTPRAW